MSAESEGNVESELTTYKSFISDSERWQRFQFRKDDVVITTPSKCGTTWMQSIVGTLIFGRTDMPINSISLWLDARLRSEDGASSILEQQNHRRFLKTHVPLDGIPHHEIGVTYITVVRHPLDVALSDFDHSWNQCRDTTRKLIRRRSSDQPQTKHDTPQDRRRFLLWWIDNKLPTDGAGPHGLQDFCSHVRTYWDARHYTNVHLFHYSDLWNDLESQMRRIAGVLGVEIDEDKFSHWVQALTLESMRRRSHQIAPEAQLGIWKSNEDFFAQGGFRDWSTLLAPSEVDHFHTRLKSLAGDAAQWILHGGDAPRPVAVWTKP